MNAAENLFSLPNGNALPYALPYEKTPNNKFYRTHDYSIIRNWKAKRKQDQLKINLWGASDIKLIAADFDTHHGFHSYDALEAYLKSIYKNQAIIFRTFSNKVKMLFLTSSNKMNKNIALETLSSILEPELFDMIDKSPTSLQICYVNKKNLSIISNSLKTCKVYDAVFPEKMSYREFKGTLPILGTDKQYIVKLNSVKERFLRTLLAMPQLMNQFDLPTTSLSESLDVTPMYVHKLLKQFINLGLLEVVDSNYTVGVKAKTYKATGKLLEILKNLYKDKKSLYKAIPKHPLPSEIKSGEWNDTVYKASFHFIGSPSKFIAWFNSMKGNHLKDRPKKVAWIIKRFFT